jgi:hypothetical protein
VLTRRALLASLASLSAACATRPWVPRSGINHPAYLPGLVDLCLLPDGRHLAATTGRTLSLWSLPAAPAQPALVSVAHLAPLRLNTEAAASVKAVVPLTVSSVLAVSHDAAERNEGPYRLDVVDVASGAAERVGRWHDFLRLWPSPDGAELLVATGQSRSILLGPRDRRARVELRVGASHAAFSSDGKHVVLASYRKLTVVERASGAVVRALEVDDDVDALLARPKLSGVFFTVRNQRAVRALDLETGAVVRYEADVSTPHVLAALADGSIVARRERALVKLSGFDGQGREPLDTSELSQLDDRSVSPAALRLEPFPDRARLLVSTSSEARVVSLASGEDLARVAFPLAAHAPHEPHAPRAPAPRASGGGA